MPPSGPGGSLPARVERIEAYSIAKPSGGSRLMARLSDRDADAWTALGGGVARAVEDRLGPWVVGNRADIRGSRWRLLPVGMALRSAGSAARALAATSPLVVRTDVAACYPSITPAVVHAALGAIGHREHARVAAGMLDGWGSEGYGGLPIGPDTSAVLANAVLRPVDEGLAGMPFLRWVDDYLIGVRDERQAGEALDRLDVALERAGLRRSGAKTAVHEGPRFGRWPGTSGVLHTSD